MIKQKNDIILTGLIISPVTNLVQTIFRLLIMLNRSVFRYCICLTLILLFSNFSFAQNKNKASDTLTDDYYGIPGIRYEDFVYSPSIKSVQLRDENFEISQPLINLNGPERLKLSFDELDADYKNYAFTYIHCNSNWEPSNLMPIEYIDGFQENLINEYKYSYNTLQRYVHYNAYFPGSASRFTLSGNYILKVYENGNPDNIIITKRFMVFQNKINIMPKITRVSDAVYNNYNQEIDFTINSTGYEITNPYSDLKVVITQNNRWDNAKTNLKPLFVKNDEMIFELSKDNVFPGGNEFRHMNTKSIRYRSDQYSKIVKDTANITHIYMVADQKRSFKQYAFESDLDGNFLIKNQDGDNSEVDADYCYVHLFLPFDVLFNDGDFYVFGGFNGWRCDPQNKMKYNGKYLGYEATLFLKQGYYDYEYAFLKDGTHTADETIVEGTHYETENTYTIYVYHKPLNKFYEQLIGVQKITTTGAY